MGVAMTNRFGSLRLGRRTVLRMMVLTIAGLMSLGVAGQARADEPQGSFWTQFTPSADTRLIFVSSSEGNDANSGMTPAQPVKTIEKGKELLRDGFPDWMLLKRGDVWETGLGFWSKGGRSVDERMVVGAYGSGAERPQLRPTGTNGGVQAIGNTETRYLAFVGMHFEPLNRQANERMSGIVWFRRGGDVLFEDLYVAGFGDNFNVQSLNSAAPVANIRINGCVIVDSWSTTSHSQGIFSFGVNGLLIENCVISSNGFSFAAGANPTIFNHNIYISHGTYNVVVRNNIIADASSHGIQLRPGGVIEDNLFIRNPIPVLISMDDGSAVGSANNSVQRNLIMYGKDIAENTRRGWGIEASGLRPAVIADNIFYSTPAYPSGPPLMLNDSGRRGVSDVLVSNNSFVNWGGEIKILGPNGGPMFEDIRFQGNSVYRDVERPAFGTQYLAPVLEVYSDRPDAVELTDNRYLYTGSSTRPFRAGTSSLSFEQWEQQIEPTANIVSSFSPPSNMGLDAYLASVGRSGGLEEFMAAARRQSRQSYDPSLSPKRVYSWIADRLPE